MIMDLMTQDKICTANRNNWKGFFQHHVFVLCQQQVLVCYKSIIITSTKTILPVISYKSEYLITVFVYVGLTTKYLAKK